MLKFSSSKEINLIIERKINDGWKYRKGKKHHILISPSNKKLAIPSTPSDYRAIKNFYSSLKHMIKKDKQHV